VIYKGKMKSFKNYLYEQDNERVAAGAILKASDTGRLGLAQRGMRGDFAGSWACLGGSCQDFETPLEAKKRRILMLIQECFNGSMFSEMR